MVVPSWSLKIVSPLALLEKIDRIEINRTVVRNGVVYYVLDVFLLHHTSRIPTHNILRAHACQPDYQVERRFTDFADLRRQTWQFAQRRHEGGHNCRYCGMFMSCILYSPSQPRLYIKLSAGVEKRKKVLQSYCNDIIGKVVSRKAQPQSSVVCQGSQSIPELVERFVRCSGAPRNPSR
jgi:hypothetical protein